MCSVPFVTITNVEHVSFLQHKPDQATSMPSLPHRPELRLQDRLWAPISTPAVNAHRQDRKSGSTIGCALNVVMRRASTAIGIKRTATGLDGIELSEGYKSINSS